MTVFTPKIPDGMVDLMKTLAKNVLQEKPENIYEYAAVYFENLLKKRDGSLDKGYGKFRSYKKYCEFMEKMEARQKRSSKQSDETDSGVGSSNTDDEAVNNVSTQIQSKDAQAPQQMEISGHAIQAASRKVKQSPQQRKTKNYSMNPKLKAQGSIERDRRARSEVVSKSQAASSSPEDSNSVAAVDASTKKSKSKPRKLSSKKPSENLIVITEETSTDVAEADEILKMSIAATTIQKAYREFVFNKRKQVPESGSTTEIGEKMSKNLAALTIQKAFRSYLNEKLSKNKEAAEQKVTMETLEDISNDENERNISEIESVFLAETPLLEIDDGIIVDKEIVSDVQSVNESLEDKLEEVAEVLVEKENVEKLLNQTEDQLDTVNDQVDKENLLKSETMEPIIMGNGQNEIMNDDKNTQMNELNENDSREYELADTVIIGTNSKEVVETPVVEKVLNVMSVHNSTELKNKISNEDIITGSNLKENSNNERDALEKEEVMEENDSNKLEPVQIQTELNEEIPETKEIIADVKLNEESLKLESEIDPNMQSEVNLEPLNSLLDDSIEINGSEDVKGIEGIEKVENAKEMEALKNSIEMKNEINEEILKEPQQISEPNKNDVKTECKPEQSIPVDENSNTSILDSELIVDHEEVITENPQIEQLAGNDNAVPNVFEDVGLKLIEADVIDDLNTESMEDVPTLIENTEIVETRSDSLKSISNGNGEILTYETSVATSNGMQTSEHIVVTNTQEESELIGATTNEINKEITNESQQLSKDNEVINLEQDEPSETVTESNATLNSNEELKSNNIHIDDTEIANDIHETETPKHSNDEVDSIEDATPNKEIPKSVSEDKHSNLHYDHLLNTSIEAIENGEKVADTAPPSAINIAPEMTEIVNGLDKIETEILEPKAQALIAAPENHEFNKSETDAEHSNEILPNTKDNFEKDLLSRNEANESKELEIIEGATNLHNEVNKIEIIEMTEPDLMKSSENHELQVKSDDILKELSETSSKETEINDSPSIKEDEPLGSTNVDNISSAAVMSTPVLEEIEKIDVLPLQKSASDCPAIIDDFIVDDPTPHIDNSSVIDVVEDKVHSALENIPMEPSNTADHSDRNRSSMEEKVINLSSHIEEVDNPTVMEVTGDAESEIYQPVDETKINDIPNISSENEVDGKNQNQEIEKILDEKVHNETPEKISINVRNDVAENTAADTVEPDENAILQNSINQQELPENIDVVEASNKASQELLNQVEALEVLNTPIEDTVVETKNWTNHSSDLLGENVHENMLPQPMNNLIKMINDSSVDTIDESNESYESESDDQIKESINDTSKTTHVAPDTQIIDSTNEPTPKSKTSVKFNDIKSYSLDTRIPYEQLSSDLSETEDIKQEKFKESCVDDTSRDENDDLSEVENFDFSSCGEDSLEAMYYSLRKNDIMLDKMHKQASEQRSAIATDANVPETQPKSPEKLIPGKETAVKQLRASKSIDSATTSDGDDVVVMLATTSTDSDNGTEYEDIPKKGYHPQRQLTTYNHDSYDDEELMNPMEYAMKQKEVLLNRMHGSMFAETNNSNWNEVVNDDEELDDFPTDKDKMDINYMPSQRKMWTTSVSETDSDYMELSNKRLTKDDFNISTALDHLTSTDSDSTIVSAATKIQAGARGFLTRRRLRRSSVGTSVSVDRHCSFGNAAIDKSLEDLIEQQELVCLDDAALKIQQSYRKYRARKNMFNNNRDQTLENMSGDSLNGDDDDDELDQYGITEVKLGQKRDYYHRLPTAPLQSSDDDHYENIIISDESHGVDAKTANAPIEASAQKAHHLSTFDALDTAQRRMTLQRGDAVQRNSTPEEIDHPQLNKSPSPAEDAADVAKINLETGEPDILANKRKNKKNVLHRSLGSRQNSMPVQIDTEVMRFIPKHLRKRIKSADSIKRRSH